MWLSNDPVADFARYDAEQSRRLKRLPTCERCGDAIQQERAVCIDGYWFCDECLDYYRREIDAD